ncbi:hypothetical protein ACFOW4_25990 [Micromonospora sp. GCM10011542]|uniref:hypothetical protein n=1 Tax=Micromonospora sp. GCM10011542 TaxID=3317337 RepID=UPI0036187018
MPASTRHHRALAVFVHCLGILAALPALPAAAPEAAAAPRPAATPPRPAVTAPPAAATTSRPALPATATTTPATPPRPATTGAAPATVAAPVAVAVAPTPPSAPPAVAPPSRAPASVPPPPVTVAVAPESSPAPRYRIRVSNQGNAPVDTTVRQELPPGSSATSISAGGWATRTGGSAAEVTWRLKLPARSTTTLGTALTATAPGQPITAPACAFTSDGSRPYDCATATWQAAAPPAAEVTEAPAWRRIPVLLAGLAVLLLLTAGLAWIWHRRRGRRRVVAAALASGGGPATGGTDGRGTVYPRPATPTPSARRRTPPVWLLVGTAVAVLAGVVGAVGWTATQRVAAIDTQKQPTSGAWMGTGVSGPVGVPLRESAFEFTVYRVSCATAGSAGGTTGGRRCQATVGVRNVTGEQQPWHGKLQRAYLPGGRFVSTDEPATRVANLGRDVFADPVAAGSRVVLPLVFTVDGRDQPRQLELRSGVFSAGVRVDMP